MKKLLIATAVMFLAGATLVRADRRLTPSGELNALATADYGGVDYSTFTMNAQASGTGIGYGSATVQGLNGVPQNLSQANGINGVFYGINYSSGATSDFVDVWDSTSSDNTKLRTADWRIYSVAASSGGVGAFSSGFSGFPKPVRFNKGLIYRPSRADFNSLNLFFYIFQ